MKLCRYGKNGFEKPGMIDAQGNIRDLSAVVEQIDQNTISPAGLAKLRKIKAETLPLVKGEPRLGVPYVGISKFVAIGLNFADHAKEANMPIPPEPPPLWDGAAGPRIAAIVQRWLAAPAAVR